MNIIRHRKYEIEFDVWEPHQRVCDAEMDAVVKHMKEQLGHTGNLKITLVSEDRYA